MKNPAFACCAETQPVISTSAWLQLASGQSLADALARYLAELPRVLGKTTVEWRLALRALTEPADGLSEVELPTPLLTRNSGSMLCWVIRQRLQRPQLLPGTLARLPQLSPAQADLFARAWMACPDNPHLDPEVVTNWLSRWPDTLAWAARALVLRHPELASRCAAEWLRRAFHSQSPHLAAFLEQRELARWGQEGVERALTSGARLAFRHHLYPVALRADEHLEPAARIASLALAGHPQAALREYRKVWMAQELPFPHPHKLLRFTHGYADQDVRQHLTSTALIDASTPDWARLECLEARQGTRQTLPEWHRLCSQDPGDAYLLVSLTEAILATPPSAAPGPIFQDVQDSWEALTEAPRWTEPAHSVLVLLEPDLVRRVERYQAHLTKAPLSFRLAPGQVDARATRACLEALVRLRRWSCLVELWRHCDCDSLRRVTTAEDYALYASLAELERTAPGGRQEILLWEGLLSLALGTSHLRFLLDHFVATRRSRAREGQDAEVYADLELQLLRRGKALGEHLLLGAGEKRASLQQRLGGCGLEALSGLLEELERKYGRRA